jgi:hypothetical protein
MLQMRLVKKQAHQQEQKQSTDDVIDGVYQNYGTEV